MRDTLDIGNLLQTQMERNNQYSHEMIALQKQLLAEIVGLRNAMTLQGLHDKTIEFLFEDKLVRLYIPNADHEYVQRCILRDRSFYETGILLKLRELVDLSGKSIVDIGANIGNHTVFFSKICGAGKCVAFEPIPYLASIVQRNIKINELLDVEVKNIALSDKAGKLAVSKFIAHNYGGTSFNEDEDGTIKAARLDDLDIGPVDFIKIDVEGAADKVLSGAKNTIVASRPDIMIELFEDEFSNAKVFLESLGYGLAADLGNSNYFFRHTDH